MISLEMWMLAMLEVVRIVNCTRFDVDGRPPIAHFSRPDAMLDVKEECIFRCPIFVLENTIQSGHKASKWDPRIIFEIHVGKYPFHA